MTPIVAGLDLSLTCTGLALIVNGDTVYTHRVKSTGKKNPTANQMAARIEGMSREITSWLVSTVQRDPHFSLADWLVVVESPSFGSKGGAAHERGGLYWGVLGAVDALRATIATVAPKTRAIYGVGHAKGVGAEGKREVRDATIARHPDIEIPDDNVADAVLLAMMGRRHLGIPLDGDLSSTFTRAMESAKWPS